MALVNANNLRLYVIDSSSGAKITVAHSQSVSLDISNSLIDVTTKDSNSWTERISGQKSFSLSTDGLLDYGVTTGQTNGIGVADWAIAGSELFFDFGFDSNANASAGPETGDVVYRGAGFISSFGKSGGTDDAPTYSISIDGNGALVKSTVA